MTEGEFSESGQKEGKSVERGLIAQEFSSSNSTDVPERKRTELGPIPEEWVIGTLRNYLKRPPSYGINAAAVPYDENLPTYIRITDIDDEGRFSPNPPVSVKNPHSGKYFLEEGDLVFARTGASVGKSYKYSISDGTLVYAGFLIRITPDHKKLNPTFLAHYAHTQKYWEWVDSISLRSGQPGINGSEYGALRVPVPPIKEQRAIAATLSDADALIDSLDRLIGKKRAIKQAAMQQLLTGETRLPGFDGEWQPKKLESVAQIDPENLGADTDLHFEFNYISLEQVVQGELTGFSEELFGEAPSRAKRIARKNDVLVSTVRPNLKGHFLYEGFPQNAVCSTGFAVVRCKPHLVEPRFVYFHMFGSMINDQIQKITAGSNYPAISSWDIGNFEILFPALGEQKAIAQVLSDMDKEIAGLEKRRDKARQIKQGMMQELLTGRVRLVAPGAAA